MGAGSTFSQGANTGVSNPYAGSTSPYFQAATAQSLGNLAGAQTATQANRVNQVTPYGNLNYTQSTDQYGNPTWTATQSLTPELQGLAQSSIQGLQQSQANPMYGINPGQTYSDAIMQRLQPQQQMQQKQFDARMANQGIPVGSEAYNNAYRQFTQAQNDQLTSAIINGMQTGLQAQQLQGNQASQIKSLATPSYINAPTQAAVAGPDYLGALGSQTAANIAAQNAALGQKTAQTAGLYGLGSAGILGAAANPGLISSGLSGLANLFGGQNNYSNIYSMPTDAWSSGNF